MKFRRYITLGFGSLLVCSLFGCAGTNSSLRVSPSNAPHRAFAAPPPTVIRMPVKVMFPKVGQIPKDMGQWLDQQIHNIDDQVHKVDTVLKTPIKDLKWPSINPADKELKAILMFWKDAQEPIFIDKDIWLVMDLHGLSSGLAQADPKSPLKLETVLEVTAYPKVVFGEKPTVQKKKIPPFSLYKGGLNGFHAIGNASISFQEANRLLADPKNGLVNRRIPGTGSYRLKIKKVELYGAEGRVVAQTLIEYYPLVNFEGNPSQMTIYFRGTPYFDPHKQAFYLKDLDFDLKTGDLLMEVAGWILKSDILNDLKKRAYIPLGPKLKKLRGRLNEVLNRRIGDYNRLATKVDSFSILDAFVDSNGIQAQMSLDGNAQLEIFGR